jgi:protein-L-isoaspartate O-methyltransferase
VLACLAPEVFTVERWPELCETATQRLERLGFRNVVTQLALQRTFAEFRRVV